MRTNVSVVFAVLQLPCGQHHRWLPIGEAERMEARGDCSRVRQSGKKSIGRTRPVYRLTSRPEPSASIPTPPSITWGETLKNLGLPYRPHSTVSRTEVAITRTKLANYRGVQQHDPMYAGAR